MVGEESRNIYKHNLKYALDEIVGQGTYGKVYKSKYNGENYAVKKISRQEGGIHITTIREIKILKSLDHKNIIKMTDINVHNGEIYIVFDFFKFDLQKYLKKNILNRREIVHITRQICEGVKFLHDNQVFHRDLKSSNILLDFDLNVKIADFGMAIPINKSNTYSPGVVTLWYRAPELLLGTSKYDKSIDLWSIGCIMAEMLNGKPLFIGDTEAKVLSIIVYFCGSIDENSFPDAKNLPFFNTFKLSSTPRILKNIFKMPFHGYIDLIDCILQVDPGKRPSINEILENDIFNSYDPNFINNLSERFNRSIF